MPTASKKKTAKKAASQKTAKKAKKKAPTAKKPAAKKKAGAARGRAAAKPATAKPAADDESSRSGRPTAPPGTTLTAYPSAKESHSYPMWLRHRVAVTFMAWGCTTTRTVTVQGNILGLAVIEDAIEQAVDDVMGRVRRCGQFELTDQAGSTLSISPEVERELKDLIVAVSIVAVEPLNAEQTDDKPLVRQPPGSLFDDQPAAMPEVKPAEATANPEPASVNPDRTDDGEYSDPYSEDDRHAATEDDDEDDDEDDEEDTGSGDHHPVTVSDADEAIDLADRDD